MYVCMYVRMYVCMYVRMYVCMYRFFYGTFIHASTNNLDSARRTAHFTEAGVALTNVADCIAHIP